MIVSCPLVVANYALQQGVDLLDVRHEPSRRKFSRLVFEEGRSCHRLTKLHEYWDAVYPIYCIFGKTKEETVVWTLDWSVLN